ncbi:MAG: RagB/SusD family nutrient uptake outer membrane protein [Longimicrobiales bacterium]
MTRSRKRTLVLGSGLLVVASAVYGCKDFLVSPPQGTLDELSLANQDGVEATLIGAYRLLGGWIPGVGAWGAASSNWPFGSVTSDDAYKGSDPADQAPITDIELYNWGTGGSESYLNDKWRSVYEGVTRSNATLRLLNRVLEESPGEISDADANGIRGEALFLRAHYHFEAWKMWENIPYYTEEDTDFRKPNTGVDAIPLILADLDEAIGLLPPTPRFEHAGRVTQWTARAYKGRVQVYSGDYPGGLTTLREVVNGGPYALEENFHQVWTGFQEFANGPETILAFQASVNDGNPAGDNANWGERLNFPHAGSPFGCCGFHQPSQNLVNFFVVDANGLPVALSDPSWNARDDNLAASAAVPLDPRLDWTVGRDGVPFKDWGQHEPSWIRDRPFGGPYSPKKNVHESASGAQSNVGWNAQHLNSVNIHLYRYADLLLLLAEAEVEAGALENARAIVNQVRERAGVAAQGPGTNAGTIAVPIDDPSITWADYSIGLYPGPWGDQAFARAAVRHERRLELAMEGHRFFDLRRWGIAPQVISDYLAEETTRRSYLTGAATFTDRHALYPIPAVQIELSRVGGEDRLQQNPGW